MLENILLCDAWFSFLIIFILYWILNWCVSFLLFLGKDAMEIAKTLNSFNPSTGQTYYAVAGNEFLPENADKVLKAGKFHNVSVLIGNNRDEGSIFLTTKVRFYI